MAAAATEAEMQEAVAAADSDLQYILQESGATLQTQYRVVQVHASRRRFQAVADTRAEARAAANRDFGIPNDTVEGRAQAAAIVAAWELAKEYTTKEVELKAEAKVLGHKRVVQVQERQAMLRAVTTMYGKLNEGETPSSEYLSTKMDECEANEPTASSLDKISSKRDNQVESLQSTVDASGHVRVTKTMQKLDMPHNSEAYRRVMKVEAHTWLCMSARFRAKSWLHGLKLESFTRFVEFILGDKVAGLRLPSPHGKDAVPSRPPWTVVLSFEFKLRVEAMKLVNEEGQTMAEALEAVMKDPSLKETWFTTPLALHAAEQPTKYRKGQGKKGDRAHPPPPQVPKGFERVKGKGKAKATLNGLQLVSVTPDGKQICYAYNSQGCKDAKCPRLHVCRVMGCFKEHPANQHESATAGG